MDGETLQKYFRLDEPHKKGLDRLGIKTPPNLLRHFPARYGSRAGGKTVEALAQGEEATLYGSIKRIKPSKGFRSKIPMTKAVFDDGTGALDLVFLHQPYIAKMIPQGSFVKITGKVSARKDKLSMVNPKMERADANSPITGIEDSLFAGEGEDLFPVYPETRGVSSEWFRHAADKLIKHRLQEKIEDPVPKEILERYNLPTLATALVWIHAPRKRKDAEAARKRFAFEEIFFIQLEKQKEKAVWESLSAFTISPKKGELEEFKATFPYKLTEGQEKAVEDIMKDISSGRPMSRLLEGDVGSGKTAIAAMSAYVTVRTRPKDRQFGSLQVAYMAPTEILATQHFESFIQYFINQGIDVGLITGSSCRKFPSKINPKGYTTISRSQLLKWVAEGNIPILIGTHALIQKSVKFKDLALAVVDEQHRFGTKQRAALIQKNHMAPHLLSMTATPIPRTLALTIFGNLDLTVLDEMPAGRKKVITKIVPPDKRDAAYEDVRKELSSGRQCYVICPRIDEPDPSKSLAIQAKSVKEEAKRLKKEVFPEFEIGILHGKMTPAEKDKTMKEFAEGKTNILVATSVVEVGVNVPNATVIIIEGAERFGLAQLHQLRGRVVRSNHQAYCFVFADARAERTINRLKALEKAKNGFELAEADLSERGAGDIAGRKQWGVSDVGMEALKNLKLVEAARNEAAAVVAEDPDLSRFPLLAKTLAERANKIHFE